MSRRIKGRLHTWGDRMESGTRVLSEPRSSQYLLPSTLRPPYRANNTNMHVSVCAYTHAHT